MGNGLNLRGCVGPRAQGAGEGWEARYVLSSWQPAHSLSISKMDPGPPAPCHRAQTGVVAVIPDCTGTSVLGTASCLPRSCEGLRFWSQAALLGTLAALLPSCATSCGALNLCLPEKRDTGSIYLIVLLCGLGELMLVTV